MLSVQDLNNDRLEKSKRNHLMYKAILENLYNKIKKKNDDGYKNYVYKIPYTYLIQSNLNPSRAIQYLIMKLNGGGFVAYPFGSIHSVYIDWSIDLNKQSLKVKKKVTFSKPKVLSDEVLDKYRRHFNK